MKKKSIITFIIIMFMMICTKVYAADPQITIEGDEKAKAGETKTITVKVVSDTYKVGTITGKIETDAKIEKIQVGDDGEGDTAGVNGWSITYNPTTRLFSAYKASGANNSEIMKFSYTVKAGETGSTTVSLSGIEMSYLVEGEYKTKNIENVSKNITIEAEKQEETTKTLKSIAIKSKPSKVSYKEGEKFSTKGMKIVANYSDGTSKEVTGYTYSPNGKLKENDTKITISYTEGKITKTVAQKITVEKEEKEIIAAKEEDKTTVKDEKLPKTGVANYVIAIMGILAIISCIVYVVYKKNYKDI